MKDPKEYTAAHGLSSNMGEGVKISINKLIIILRIVRKDKIK